MTAIAFSVLAAAPAVPYDKAGRYVAAAFIVLFAIMLIYVAIMATKLQRLERELSDLNDALQRRDQERAAAAGDSAESSEPLARTSPEAP